MRALRRFTASKFGQSVVAALVVLYVRLVFHTNRWQRINYDIAYRLEKDGRRGAICFWHSRLLMLAYMAEGSRPYYLLSSDHRDGQLIARAVSYFGINVFHGSSSRRPIQTMMRAAEISAAGGVVLMAPDGPRGPRMRAAPGPVTTAGLVARHLENERPAGTTSTKAVLLPVAYATTRRKMLNSWDRFLLPLPFGRGVFVVHPAIEISAGLDPAEREAMRLRLEEALNAVTAEADRLTGHPTVEPAPARTFPEP